MSLIPGSGQSPGVGNTYSSILAWKIPWTGKPGWLQPMGVRKSDTTELLHMHSCNQSEECPWADHAPHNPLPLTLPLALAVETSGLMPWSKLFFFFFFSLQPRVSKLALLCTGKWTQVWFSNSNILYLSIFPYPCSWIQATFQHALALISVFARTNSISPMPVHISDGVFSKIILFTCNQKKLKHLHKGEKSQLL